MCPLSPNAGNGSRRFASLRIVKAKNGDFGLRLFTYGSGATSALSWRKNLNSGYCHLCFASVQTTDGSRSRHDEVESILNKAMAFIANPAWIGTALVCSSTRIQPDKRHTAHLGSRTSSNFSLSVPRRRTRPHCSFQRSIAIFAGSCKLEKRSLRTCPARCVWPHHSLWSSGSR